MTCEDAREWLSALVDEAIGPDERCAVEAHLAGCGECRRELERVRSTVGLLRAMPAERAPAGFVDRVLAAARPVPWPRRLVRWLFVPLPVKLPLEAAALVLVSVSALYVIQRSPDLQRAIHQGAPVDGLAPPASTVSPPAGSISPAVLPDQAGGTAGLGTAESAREPQSAPVPSKPRARATLPPERTTDFRAGAQPGPATAPSASEALPPGSAAPPVRTDAVARDAAKAEAPPSAPPLPAVPSAAPPPAVSEPPASPPPAAGLRPAAPPAPAKEQGAGGAVTSEARPDAARNLAAPGRLLAKTRPSSAPDVTGRLAVPAREAAERAIDDLVGRLGGARLGRQLAPDAGRDVIVDLVVPREAYAELAAGLGRIGRWTPGREPETLAPEVRVEVTLSE